MKTVATFIILMFMVFIFIALVDQANKEVTTIHECYCRVDTGLRSYHRDTIRANDFWYEKERFVWTWEGDTLTQRNTYCYCDDVDGWSLLPERR